MTNGRWANLVFVISTTGTLLFGSAVLATGQPPTPRLPQPRQSPNAPVSQNVPQGLDGVPVSPASNTASLGGQNDEEIRRSVEHLYTLVTDLKKEVDQTNSNMILNTSLVKRAQEIEKLAKQIKDRARK
jgi:hypothetical protein